jgi:hypothetical protein
LSDVTNPIRDLNVRAMRFLRGERTEPEWTPVQGRRDLVSIPQDEAEAMVDALATESRARLESGELEGEVAKALARGLQLITGREPATSEAAATAASVAGFGYLARVAEWERLATARRMDGWMVSGLRGAVRASVAEELEDATDAGRTYYDALGEVTAFFVGREPLDVPYDTAEGFALMWTIPGTGGEVRALLRERTLPMALERSGSEASKPDGASEGAGVEVLRRVWKYGFVLRSFEEFFWEG